MTDFDNRGRQRNQMTEKEWLVCTDLYPILTYLRQTSSDRKIRLFIVACHRRILHLISEPSIQSAIEVIERFADGLATETEMRKATKHITWGGLNLAENDQAPNDATQDTARLIVQRAPLLVGGVYKKAVAAQLIDLHDIFGNPFHPVPIDATWLSRHDGTIPKIAQTIYEERSFANMPILADALEDAGCTDDDILNHCRSERPHARGCWVLDLLLGKK